MKISLASFFFIFFSMSWRLKNCNKKKIAKKIGSRPVTDLEQIKQKTGLKCRPETAAVTRTLLQLCKSSYYSRPASRPKMGGRDVRRPLLPRLPAMCGLPPPSAAAMFSCVCEITGETEAQVLPVFRPPQPETANTCL